MSFEQTRASLMGKIWQSIAQSGVDLSSIPREQQEQLVRSITDGALAAFNDLIGAEQSAPLPDDLVPSDEGEQTLWEGRPFLSLSEHYLVTSERIRIIRGVFSKDREDVELIRLQDIDHTQRLTERMVNIGDITLRSADSSRPEVILRNVPDPEEVHEIIRKAMLAARKRHRVTIRDQI